MTSADEVALSFYIPLLLVLTIAEIMMGAYESKESAWNQKLAFVKLILNMSWTCTLFPLFLDHTLFGRMIDALYDGRPGVASPFNEQGLVWLSGLLVCSLFIVNTIDVYQSSQLAQKQAMKE